MATDAVVEAYEEPNAWWVLNNSHCLLFIKLPGCFSRDQSFSLLQQRSHQLRNQESQLCDQGII